MRCVSWSLITQELLKIDAAVLAETEAAGTGECLLVSIFRLGGVMCLILAGEPHITFIGEACKCIRAEINLACLVDAHVQKSSNFHMKGHRDSYQNEIGRP